MELPADQFCIIHLFYQKKKKETLQFRDISLKMDKCSNKVFTIEARDFWFNFSVKKVVLFS